jgi:hypothetical protein
VYASVYYESSNCSGPADLLGTFTASPAGHGDVNGKIDDDLDEVGSVSVRLGPDYGTLFDCATVHGWLRYSRSPAAYRGGASSWT